VKSAKLTAKKGTIDKDCREGQAAGDLGQAFAPGALNRESSQAEEHAAHQGLPWSSVRSFVFILCLSRTACKG
jgi:hypothetical protein